METDLKKRFDKALREVRSQGITVKQNVNMCCRNCIELDDLGITDWDQPYVFTYGEQGSGYRWIDGKPIHTKEAKGEPVKVIHFNHGGEGDPALALAIAMKNQGFVVEWDGSDTQCPTVRF